MITAPAMYLYKTILTNGWRGRGKLLEALSIFPKSWRETDITFPSGITVRIDMGKKASIGFLDAYYQVDGQLEALYKIMESVCRPTDVLWDIGGHIGLVSLHFAWAQFGLREIHLFEPNPHQISRLEQIFKGSKVSIHPFGMGREKGCLELSVPTEGSSLASFVQFQEEAVTRYSVEVWTGDALVTEQGIAPPDVVKIDVEGFEPEVIKGMQRLIRSHQPIIFLEYLFLTDEQCYALIPEDYDFYLITDKGELIRDFARRKEGHNLVMFPENKADYLNQSA